MCVRACALVCLCKRVSAPFCPIRCEHKSPCMKTASVKSATIRWRSAFYFCQAAGLRRSKGTTCIIANTRQTFRLQMSQGYVIQYLGDRKKNKKKKPRRQTNLWQPPGVPSQAECLTRRHVVKRCEIRAARSDCLFAKTHL